MRKKLYIILPFLFLLILVIFVTTNITISTKNTEKYLSSALEQLHKIGKINETDNTKDVVELLNNYTSDISQALKGAEKITNIENKKRALVLVFQRVASQLAVLRTIQRRRPTQDSAIIEKNRDLNVKIQEEAIERLSLFFEDPSVNRLKEEVSNTASTLSCLGCNVIIVSLTTLRKDRMGIYGYEKETTPNIDAFFKNSMRFNNTTAPSSWTTPDAISLFTSLFPYRHGIMTRDPAPLYNRKVLTLTEILKKNDYRTAAFTGGGDYNNRYSGLRRGFDFYLDENNFSEFGIAGNIQLGAADLLYAPLQSFLQLSTNWLEKNFFAKKFFIFLQGYDTHCPLDPREPFAKQFTKGLQSDLDFSTCHWTHEDTLPSYENRERYWAVKAPIYNKGIATEVKLSQTNVEYMNALYDARIVEIDFYLNNFWKKVKNLGLEKNTIIVLMSDHGEMLGEHGRFMRGGTLRGTSYEPALSFPLLIKHPKVDEPIIVNDLVQTVDIMPTILSMLGLEDPQQIIREGKALRFSNFQDNPINKHIFFASAYTPNPSSQFFNQPTTLEGIRDEKWKLVKETFLSADGLEPVSVSYKLFNLAEDPEEEKNIYESEVIEAVRLTGELEQWLSTYK